MCCGLSRNKIYGPYFFEDPESEQPLSINTGNYFEMLTKILSNNTFPDKWFQQDGSIVHTTRDSMNWLKTRFPQQLMSHRSDFPWLGWSPDLSPLDISLGFCKREYSVLRHLTQLQEQHFIIILFTMRIIMITTDFLQ